VLSFGSTDMCVGWYIRPVKMPRTVEEEADRNPDDGLPIKRSRRKKAAAKAQSQEPPAEACFMYFRTSCFALGLS
jgi:hypothetical protein